MSTIEWGVSIVGYGLNTPRVNMMVVDGIPRAWIYDTPPYVASYIAGLPLQHKTRYIIKTWPEGVDTIDAQKKYIETLWRLNA